MKDRSSYFSDEKNGWWGRHRLPEIWAKVTLLERKRRLSIYIRLYRLGRNT